MDLRYFKSTGNTKLQSIHKSSWIPIVLYNSSAKDANSTIVKREDIDFEFIVESVTYVFFTSSLNEAYYLTAIFNSAAPNKMMKDFQARGLYGARHVHKKILDIYYPRFDAGDETHLELAELSRAAHEKASAYTASNVKIVTLVQTMR